MVAKIRINEVTKAFTHARLGNIHAIKHLDLSIEDSEIYCLVGPSGCGKSTALNLVAGFETPTTGSILLENKPVTQPGPDRAMVFQQPLLFPWLTVLDNITFGLTLGKSTKAAAAERAKEYIEEIGLGDFTKRYPYELSGGMQQRVALARAWVNTPDVLLLDEPFGALDAQTRTAMHSLLLKIWANHATTILFITHDIEEAIFLGDRIGVMSPRPGVLQRELRIDLRRPRDVRVTTTSEFADIKRQILDELHFE